jgi:hypothetical protein
MRSWKNHRRGCRDLCKFRRIHYGLAKNACSLCSKSRTDTHKVKRCPSSNWQDAQTGLVVSPILWRCLLRQLMRYLVVFNFGCLIQSLDFLQLLSAIQCLECASKTHFLFISRKLTVECKAAVHRSGSPSPLSSAYQPPHYP